MSMKLTSLLFPILFLCSNPRDDRSFVSPLHVEAASFASSMGVGIVVKKLEVVTRPQRVAVTSASGMAAGVDAHTQKDVPKAYKAVLISVRYMAEVIVAVCQSVGCSHLDVCVLNTGAEIDARLLVVGVKRLSTACSIAIGT
jgi:hypothetical protein